VTPNPGDRNGPVALWLDSGRAALPYGSGVTKPKGGTAYPMRATGNNHAFAFMEPALCAGAFEGDAEPAETALAQASTVPGPLYPRSTLWLRAQDPKGGSATSVWARANHPPTVAHTTPPAKSVTPVKKINHIQLLRIARLNRWTVSDLAWPSSLGGH